MAFFGSNKTTQTEGTQMSFLQHLEEFRWHLVRSAAVIALFAITAFCLNDFIFDTNALFIDFKHQNSYILKQNRAKTF